MRNWRSHIYAGVAALLASAATAFALVIPPSFAPRQFPTQQVHYLRFTVNFNDCVLASGTCSVKRGSVPYNSMILRASQQIITSFNSATTDTIALGANSNAAIGILVSAQSVHGASGGMTSLTVLAANAGIVVTGNGTPSNGTNGGFDIFSIYAQTGTAPTAGQAVYVVEYIAPNDGSCAPVPLGSTASAC